MAGRSSNSCMPCGSAAWNHGPIVLQRPPGRLSYPPHEARRREPHSIRWMPAGRGVGGSGAASATRMQSAGRTRVGRQISRVSECEARILAAKARRQVTGEARGLPVQRHRPALPVPDVCKARHRLRQARHQRGRARRLPARPAPQASPVEGDRQTLSHAGGTQAQHHMCWTAKGQAVSSHRLDLAGPCCAAAPAQHHTYIRTAACIAARTRWRGAHPAAAARARRGLARPQSPAHRPHHAARPACARSAPPEVPAWPPSP